MLLEVDEEFVEFVGACVLLREDLIDLPVSEVALLLALLDELAEAVVDFFHLLVPLFGSGIPL